MLLIDGDILTYRCSASCEPSKKKAIDNNQPELSIVTEPLFVAIGRLESLLERILKEVNTTDFRIFLSGQENFRKIIFPEYKANRKDQKRPTWLENCREHLIVRWKAEVCIGYEADDGIGIAHDDRSIVASIDKDLLQLPGRHFNFVKNEWQNVSLQQSERKVWELMLTGDTADNIRGIQGVGPATAKRILDETDPLQWRERVKELYADEGRFLLNERLLRVLRSMDEWEEVQKLDETSFSQSKREESTEEGQGFDFDHIPHTNS